LPVRLAAWCSGYRRSSHERSYPTSGPVSTGMGDRLWADIPPLYLASQLDQLSLASPGVAKSSTSFGWGKGWNVTSAGWQVTLCDPIWHVSSSSGVATSVSELLYPCYFTLLLLTRKLSSPTWLVKYQDPPMITHRSTKRARRIRELRRHH